MPESPRWLESVGRLAEAEATLAAIEREVSASVGALPPARRVVDLQVGKAPLSALFKRGMFSRTAVAALTSIGINVALYGFVAWLPTFFVAQGLSIVKSLGFVFFMSIGSPVGGWVGYLIADRVGRTKGLIVSSAVSVVLGWLYVSLHDTVTIIAVGFCLVTAIYTITTLGLFGYIPELFPTEVRLRGTGVAGMCGRASSIVTPYLALVLYEQFGVSGVIAMVSVVLAVLTVAVALLRVETSRHTLEEIAPSTVESGDSATAGAAAAARQTQ
jgi:putative MFS transporter